MKRKTREYKKWVNKKIEEDFEDDEAKEDKVKLTKTKMKERR